MEFFHQQPFIREGRQAHSRPVTRKGHREVTEKQQRAPAHLRTQAARSNSGPLRAKRRRKNNSPSRDRACDVGREELAPWLRQCQGCLTNMDTPANSLMPSFPVNHSYCMDTPTMTSAGRANAGKPDSWRNNLPQHHVDMVWLWLLCLTWHNDQMQKKSNMVQNHMLTPTVGATSSVFSGLVLGDSPKLDHLCRTLTT